MSRKSGGGRRKKPGTGAKLALGIVTFVNLLLTLILAAQRRKDVLRAVSEDGKVRLLLEQGEKTSRGE